MAPDLVYKFYMICRRRTCHWAGVWKL